VRFSIVTPSYNQADFLSQTIESVLAQDYPNFEYMVMDGGSTDGSLDILRRYDRRLKWVSEPDQGQTDAINKGFRLASGDVFAWLNSDDTYLPGALTEVAAFFEQNPTVGLAYGDIRTVDRAGRLIKSRAAPEFDADLLARTDFIPQPATFFLASVWRTIGGLDATLNYMFDWDAWIRMASVCTVRKIPATLAEFRFHRQSKTVSKAMQAAYEGIYIVRRRYRQPSGWEDSRDFGLNVLRSVGRAVIWGLQGHL